MNNLLLALNLSGGLFIALGIILTIVVFALAVWLIGIGQRGEQIKLKLKPKHIFLIVLVVGAVLRIVVSISMRGLVGSLTAPTATRTGYTGIFNMTYALINDGLDNFWAAYESALYYPITMYVLAFFASIGSLFFPLGINSIPTLIFLKLPFIISDILLAYVIYKIAAKFANELVALALGGLVALSPVFMFGSIWPSYYTFFALALAIMIYYMLERSYVRLIITYAVSVLVCFEAIFLLPVVSVFLVYAYVKKMKAYKNETQKTGLWNSEYGMLVKVPVAAVVCIIGAYLLTLPFALGHIGANPFKMIFIMYIKPFNEFAYFTFNGLSLYNIFNKNGVALSLSFPTYIFSILFILAITAVTLIIYLSKKNRAGLVMFISYLLFTINVYFVNSSELTLLPSLIAMLLGYAVLKEKRLLHIFAPMALIVFINATGVLIKSDYFMTNAVTATELLNETWSVLSIVSSVITVLLHIYFTIILLDVIMNGRIKKLTANDNKFSSSLKGLIKNKE